MFNPDIYTEIFSGSTEIVISLSLANLCLVRRWQYLLFCPEHGFYARAMIPGVRQLSESFLAFLILSFIIYISLTCISHIPAGYSILARVSFLSILGVFAAGQLLICFPRNLQHWWQDFRRKSAAIQPKIVSNVTSLFLTLLLIIFVVFYVYISVPLLVFLSPLVLVVLGFGMFRAINPQVRLEIPKAAKKVIGARSPRVIWLIIDEFDQRLGVESRPEGLELANLDKLLKSAFSASDALPPCHCTEISIPALLIGKMVKETRVSANECMLQLESGAADTPLSSSDHIFRKIGKKNLNCAVSGWYHPYDRLFGDSLSFCRWYDDDNYEDRSPRQGLSYMAGVLRGVFESPRYSLFGSSIKAKRWRNMWKYILRDSVEIVQDQNVQLGFLHWNIPHAPYINDRQAWGIALQKRQAAGYFGNLELMDGGLGLLMEEIDQFDDVSLIVSSDHWWREAGKFDGIIDRRVPFIVKLANQQSEFLYKQKFNTVLTADLVLEILEGKVTNVDELNSWMMSNGEDIPPSKGWA